MGRRGCRGPRAGAAHNTIPRKCSRRVRFAAGTRGRPRTPAGAAFRGSGHLRPPCAAPVPRWRIGGRGAGRPARHGPAPAHPCVRALGTGSEGRGAGAWHARDPGRLGHERDDRRCPVQNNSTFAERTRPPVPARVHATSGTGPCAEAGPRGHGNDVGRGERERVRQWGTQDVDMQDDTHGGQRGPGGAGLSRGGASQSPFWRGRRRTRRTKRSSNTRCRWGTAVADAAPQGLVKWVGGTAVPSPSGRVPWRRGARGARPSPRRWALGGEGGHLGRCCGGGGVAVQFRCGNRGVMGGRRGRGGGNRGEGGEGGREAEEHADTVTWRVWGRGCGGGVCQGPWEAPRARSGEWTSGRRRPPRARRGADMARRTGTHRAHGDGLRGRGGGGCSGCCGGGGGGVGEVGALRTRRAGTGAAFLWFVAACSSLPDGDHHHNPPPPPPPTKKNTVAIVGGRGGPRDAPPSRAPQAVHLWSHTCTVGLGLGRAEGGGVPRPPPFPGPVLWIRRHVCAGVPPNADPSPRAKERATAFRLDPGVDPGSESQGMADLQSLPTAPGPATPDDPPPLTPDHRRGPMGARGRRWTGG